MVLFLAILILVLKHGGRLLVLSLGLLQLVQALIKGNVAKLLLNAAMSVVGAVDAVALSSRCRCACVSLP